MYWQDNTPPDLSNTVEVTTFSLNPNFDSPTALVLLSIIIILLLFINYLDKPIQKKKRAIELFHPKTPYKPKVVNSKKAYKRKNRTKKEDTTENSPD